MNLAQPPAGPATGAGWLARLELTYGRKAASTRLIHRLHHGPLTVQKALYPEGPDVCHSLLLHPPGGIAGGDRLELDVDVQDGAQALLTTPGAAKWYRSAGPTAEQQITLHLGPSATLEWLPQENIAFDHARVRTSNRVELSADAKFIGWDITRFGRTASGEHFSSGEFRNRIEVLRDGRRIWGDYACIAGGATLLQSPAGLAGCPVLGTLLATGAALTRDMLDACRAVQPPDAARCGVTQLQDVFAARYLGASTEAARAYFVALWRLLRPAVLGRDACVPRIWST